MAIPFLSPVNTTADIRLPANGKLFLWTGHNDNFLRYNLWQTSASAGMTIKNIASSGDIYFQTNSSTALTLDSNQNVIANAFTGRLQGATTGAPDATIWCVSGEYTNWGIFYNEGTPDKIEFKASGSVTSSITLDNGNISTIGNIVTTTNSAKIQTPRISMEADGTLDWGQARNAGTLTWDSDYAYLKGQVNKGVKIQVNNTTTALTFETDANATFAGSVGVGGSPGAKFDVNAGTTNTVAIFESTDDKAFIILKDDTTSTHLITKDNKFSIGESSTDYDNFKVDITTGDTTIAGDITLSTDADILKAGTNPFRVFTNGTLGLSISASQHATFAGSVTARGIHLGGLGDYITFYGGGETNHSITSRQLDGGTGDDIRVNTYGSFIVNLDSNNNQSAAANSSFFVGRHGGNASGISGTNLLFQIDGATGNVLPGTDSTHDLGTSSNRWANVYADTLHGTVAQANNLQAFDDRDMAPEDMSYSDDLKLFFVEKSGIEGGTVGTNYQDALFISSYVDSSGGNPNLLAFDKSQKKIYHYQASATAASWGTPKELAYTDSVLNLSGGTLQGNIAMGDNDITGLNKITFTDGVELFGSGTNNYLKFKTLSTSNGGILFQDGDNTTQGYLYYDGNATSSFGFLDGTGSWAVRCLENQYVELRYDNSTKLRTASAGVTITGTMEATNDVVGAGDLSIRNVKLNQGNSPTITLGVINSSTGNSKIQFYSKNSGAANGYALQYNKDTGIDRLEFIDGSGNANIKFNNGGAAEFAGSVTATQINTGQGATEVHLMNQNLRTTDDVTFDDLTVTGNLTITGDINSYNVTDLDITDKTITLGKGQDEGHSGGSGLVVDGSGASILWDESNDTWDFNKGVHISGQLMTQALDASASIVQHLRCSDGSNAATFRTTTTGRIFEIRSQNSGSLKFDSTSSTFTGHVNAATGFRMASGQAIDFVSTNIGYNSIERNTSVGGLQINTGDTASMNILDNGNVGINSTSPEEKLTISTGNVQFRKTASAANTSLGFLGWKNTYATGTHVAAKIDVLTRNESSSAHDYTNLVFYTWNGYNSLSEKMRIADDGNVGIGYDNPYKKLHLHNPTDSGTPDCQMNFTTGVTEAGDGNGFRVGWNGSVANMYLFENADMRFATNNSERMRIKADGKVGIGTTSPGAALEVRSDGSAAGGAEIRLQHANNNSTDVVSTVNFANNAGSVAMIQGGTTGANNTGYISFFTDNSGTSSEKMRILGNGRVGIGLTTVKKDLEIEIDNSNNVVTTGNSLLGGDSGAGVLIRNSNTTTNSYANLDFRANNADGRIAYQYTGTANQGDFHFVTDNTSSAKSSMVIKNDGKIGIGTISPESQLTIKGDPGNTNQPVRITNNATDTHTGLFLNGTGNAVNEKYGLQFGNYNEYSIGGIFGVMDSVSGSTSGDITIDFGDGTSAGALVEKVRFTHEGRVGIGTNAPTNPLHVKNGDSSGSNTYSLIKVENGTNHAEFGALSGYARIRAAGNEIMAGSWGATYFYNSGVTGLTLTGNKTGVGTTSPTYKLSVAGAISGAGFVTYTKSYGSLNATGNAVAGITASANGNGSSCGFTFTCFGGTGKYQKVVYSCYNDQGTWRTRKVIDEGTNDLDVAASADGSTITFTFKATSSSQSYTPRVKVEAEGHNINSTYA
tara:strand:- start:7887 stop:12854 length:4968 start_codon:yes stop_codon:yes gene_type:complete